MYEWMCDPEVRDNIGLQKEPSLERTLAWITSALHNDSMRPFAVLLDGRHVGNIILDRMDPYLSTARLSVYIGEPSARGSGVGLTAIYLALQEGFETLRLHKIWLTVHARNVLAIRTYVALGFALEGILRDEFRLRGERLAAFYMGLLAEEFRRLVVEKSGTE
jgi:RimJ/RimL family protein N-acetyltransferase